MFLSEYIWVGGVLWVILFLILDVMSRGIYRLISVKPFSGKGGEAFGDQASIFVNVKPGTTCRAGLIPWIEQCPTIAQYTALGTLTLYHINPYYNPNSSIIKTVLSVY